MVDYKELSCRIALTRAKGVGPIIAKRLLERMGSAKEIFEDRKLLCSACGRISNRLLDSLFDTTLMKKAEKYADWVIANNVQCLAIDSSEYPFLLKQIPDAPSLLYYLGDPLILNSNKILAVVGTRSMTSYGERCCREFIQELSSEVSDIVIISGLAYGVDVTAHQSALNCGVPTVGVLAHGLDRIYPSVHRAVAKDMTTQGGLITEYPDHTNPDRFNFVSRNRIIAGMSHATLVVESSSKGGSLITAQLAMDYDREVFAIPGRITDRYSLGCNKIIKRNNAVSVSSARDIIDYMGWSDGEKTRSEKKVEVKLPENPDQLKIVKCILKNGPQQINNLCIQCGMDMSRLSNVLFELEFGGIVNSLPGGVYDIR